MINISEMTSRELEKLVDICNEELASRKTEERKKVIEDFRHALETLSEHNIDVYFTDDEGYEVYVPSFNNLHFEY